jgi:hypothetical protein
LENPNGNEYDVGVACLLGCMTPLLPAIPDKPLMPMIAESAKLFIQFSSFSNHTTSFVYLQHYNGCCYKDLPVRGLDV